MSNFLKRGKRIKARAEKKEIKKRLKDFYKILGELDRVAEEIKINIGTAVAMDEELTMIVNGRDQVEGLLSSVELTSEDAREAMKDAGFLSKVSDEISERFAVVSASGIGGLQMIENNNFRHNFI